MSSINWGNLEYVLAVARRGSLAAAARELKVDHTTVFRRVVAFEEHVDVRIFERLRSGYILTPEGEVFLDAAKSIEKTVAELDRKIAGSDTTISGPLSITTTDSIFPFLTEEIEEYRKQYPAVFVDLTITNSRLDLDVRDADIAIRASSAPPLHLVGRRICDINFGIYGIPSMISTDEKFSMEDFQWIGPSSSWAFFVGEWMAQNISPEKIVLHTNSFISQRALAEEGAGLAILPRFLGDDSEKLERIPVNVDDLKSGLWLLSHKDILRSRRVKAATDFFYQALSRKKGDFEGY